MSPTDGTTGQRRSPLTGRAAVLAIVVAVLVLSAIVPLRAFFTQRADLAELRARTAAQEKRVAALEDARERWNDPKFVEAQARARLHFVMPGEVGYVVLDEDEAPAAAARSRAASAPDQPWYSTLWGSVRAADANSDARR
jgi:cell division protein FtsB